MFEASCDQLAVVLVYNQGFCDTDEQSDGCRSIVSVAFQIFNTQPLPLNPLLAFHDFSRHIVFKLVEAAPKTWRRLDGNNQLSKLILGVKFADGLEVVAKQANWKPATAA